MVSDQKLEFYPNSVLQLASVKRETSNDDGMYDLPDSSTPFRPMTPYQRRSHQLKTYTSTRLRAVTSFTTPTNESNTRAEALSALQPHHLYEVNHHVAPTVKIQVNKQPIDARPVVVPLKGNRTNTRLPEKLPCTVSKAYIEQALTVTPVIRRQDKRRQQMPDQVRPASQQSRWAVRKILLHRGQKGEKPTPEQHIANEVVQNQQHGDSQDSAESEESFKLEKSIRKVQHKSQLSPNNQPKANVSTVRVTRQGDLPVILEEEHEDDESAESDENDEQ